MTVQREAGHLSIAVADTGVGIPAPELDRGFGVGLTIVRHIALFLGYVVIVESALVRGTTLSVQIPAEQLGAATAETVARVVLLRKPVDARQLVLKLEELFGSAG